MQDELGNEYIVYVSNKFEIYNKKTNHLYRIGTNNTIEFVGNYLTDTITKTGNSYNPVILSETGISDVKINYSDGQNLSILGINRFNIEESSFIMNSYNGRYTITKENNGITIESPEFETVIDSGYAYTDIVAEFSGKMWVSCEAMTNGNIKDVGMRVVVNGESQELCRGTGKLAESVEVKQGDSIRIYFHSHIGTTAANTISYKNIMVQYGTLTDYVPYIENISSLKNTYNTIILNGNEGIEAYTTDTTASGGTDYRFTYNTKITDAGDKVLPTNNDKTANLTVNGISLKSYNEIYNNQIGIGIGVSGAISIYLGSGYTRTALIEYLKDNPITIKYATSTQEFIGLDDNIELSTGNIITSEDDFSVTYSYFAEQDKYTLVCFGDSITGMFQNETDYPSMISREANIKAYNVGFSGTTWIDYPGSNSHIPFSMNRLVDAVCSRDFSSQDANVASCGSLYAERLNTLKSIDFTKVDYVTIFYGTNDWAYGSLLKSENDSNTEQKQQSNVESSVEYCINKLKKTYPNLKIIVLSPYWRLLNKNYCDTTPNKNEDYLYEFSNLIENTSENKCNVETINMYNILNINSNNYTQYLFDEVHPNENLKHIISNNIINKIKNN